MRKGRPRINYTKQEKDKIVKNICNLIPISELSIQKICNKYGISYRLFWAWATEVKEYEKMYTNAKKKYNTNKKEAIKDLAINALYQNLLPNKTKTKTKTITEADGSITKHVTVEDIIPSTSIIALALNNLDEDFNRDIINGDTTVTVTIKPKSLDIKDDSDDDDEE